MTPLTIRTFAPARGCAIRQDDDARDDARAICSSVTSRCSRSNTSVSASRPMRPVC